MFKSVGLLVIAGGAAYTYLVEPAWVNWGFGEARCWLKGGVAISADAKEPGYVAEMSKLTQNKGRLETGEATGCMPEAKCAMSPAEALGMVDRKIFSWGLVQEYNRKKITLLNNLHDGKGFDLPGTGIASRAEAVARLDEADYCTMYLEKTRATLEKALQQGLPTR
ncbi:MAG: hypothetical protein GC129_07140 [Proteobacteria bacterium]|nr:hypothetical protein [Pseudomonadota bacterium]